MHAIFSCKKFCMNNHFFYKYKKKYRHTDAPENINTEEI